MLTCWKLWKRSSFPISAFRVLDVKGVLQFHGVNKETSFKATTKSLNGATQVTGNFIFLLEDFKIERPSFMLKPVDNEVKVKFDVFY